MKMEVSKAIIIIEAVIAETADAFILKESMHEALWTGIAALKEKEENRWHSVTKEGNPPNGGYYMWSAVGGEVEKDFYWEGEWEHAKKYGYDVLAWKPVPKRYEVDE